MPVYQLPKEALFPHPSEAVDDGLLAIGGDLAPERLVAAYASGIFPWYGDNDPILWWSPNPRLVLYPEKFKVSKSLKQTLKKQPFDIRIDFAFDEVIESCSKIPRKGQDGTWITSEMIEAFKQMHKIGLAHSIETWEGNKLVGGLYGLSLGNVFFGESMFHKRKDASKIAFYYLSQLCKKWCFAFIDCQVTNPHLLTLGAQEITRDNFLDELAMSMEKQTQQGIWEFDF
ncbi:MAG: leucyl/phenylalanyl-tRNA--protein transferase [Salinivirgaceae bacterium]|jgi:leucyl/phenylalanyl-tRNA--protein transferase|nr:leucyl/phenylalanyl-tRNA--protein transferase [Salinivirgaceae bacterium]